MTAPENTDKAKPAKKDVSKFKRLTSSQKAEAIALWRSGAATLDDLSKRFSKTQETFSRLFTKEGIKKGESADRHATKVEKKVEDAIFDDAGEMARRIKEVKEETYKTSRGLTKLIWNEIVSANRDKRQVSTTMSNLKALEKAGQALRIAREETYVALGIADGEKDDDATIPELKVQELTAADILEIQRKQNEEESQENDEGDGLLDIADVDDIEVLQ